MSRPAPTLRPALRAARAPVLAGALAGACLALAATSAHGAGASPPPDEAAIVGTWRDHTAMSPAAASATRFELLLRLAPDHAFELWLPCQAPAPSVAAAVAASSPSVGPVRVHGHWHLSADGRLALDAEGDGLEQRIDVALRLRDGVLEMGTPLGPAPLERYEGPLPPRCAA